MQGYALADIPFGSNLADMVTYAWPTLTYFFE